MSSEFAEAWFQPDFADSTWSNAYSEGEAAHLKNPEASAIWLTNFDETAIAQLDTGSAAQVVPAATGQGTTLEQIVTRPDTVYFRRSFELDGLPISGHVVLYTDDWYTLFVNGEQVGTAQPDSGVSGVNGSHDISKLIRTGKNVIAIEVRDTDASHGSLESLVEIKTLSNWSDLQNEFPDITSPESGQIKAETNTTAE